MQGSKRLAVVGAALALGALGATSTAAAATARTKAASSAAAAPTTITYTAADVAAISAHLPKGAHVKLVSSAQHSSTVRPAITPEGCTPGWGVEVWDQNWNCTAYGYTGTTGYLGYYASEALTNNNYGWISFNKDLSEHSGEAMYACEDFEWYTGTHSTALIQYIHIDGWYNATCGNWLVVSY